MTVLQPGELLTAIRIPATWAGAQFYFEKVRDRQRVGLPAGERGVGDQVRRGRRSRQARIAVGAVAARPLRLTAVEAAIAGQAAQRRDGDDGRASWRSRARRPLRYNGYKIPLMRNLVKRAIRGTGTTATT